MAADLQAQHLQLLQHYIKLARLPAWKAYVKARLQEMAKDCPELYGDWLARVDLELKRSATPGSPPASLKTTAAVSHPS